MNILLLTLKYFPLILQAVVVVEQIASNKEGKDKKALVVDSINAATQLLGNVDNEQVKVVGTLIDTTVTVLNKTGIFQTSKSIK